MTNLRIDELPITVVPTRLHAVPSMKDGLTVQLTVGQMLDLLVDSAPVSLNTLDKIAAALGDDPAFAASMTTALAGKASVVSVTTITPIFGNVKLTLSGGNLVLNREKGSKLTIAGVPTVIPSGGVSLAPTGLTPASIYYIYAAVVSGNVVLEASTTAYAIDATTGQALKSGDATRTLVGVASPVAGPAWQDLPNSRLVRSWYNDQGVTLQSSFSADRATASSVAVELNTEIRTTALMWTGEYFDATCAGTVANNTANGRNQTYLGFDGTTAGGPGNVIIESTTGNTNQQMVREINFGLASTEGIHYATLVASVQSGTGSWYGSAGRRTTIQGRVARL